MNSYRILSWQMQEAMRVSYLTHNLKSFHPHQLVSIGLGTVEEVCNAAKLILESGHISVNVDLHCPNDHSILFADVSVWHKIQSEFLICNTCNEPFDNITGKNYVSFEMAQTWIDAIDRYN